VLAAATLLLALLRPAPAPAASPCPAIGSVAEWDATIDYTWEATFTQLTSEVQSHHQVSATAHLTCPSCTPGAPSIEWSGVAQGSGVVHDVVTDTSSDPPIIHHTDGDGPLVSSQQQPFGIVYLDVDLVACTYRVTFNGPAIDTTVDGGDIGNAAIGTLRGGKHPLVSASSIDASGSYPAHSDIWGGMHPDDDAYGPQGGAPILGFLSEPDAGSASVTFTLAGDAEQLEVVVTPTGYDTWLPLGGHSESAEGNTLPVKAILQKKGGGAPKTKATSFTFELIDVSHEPGVCLNFPATPDANPGADLKFVAARNPPPLQPAGDGVSLTAPGASNKATATLSSYDFGGYATLRVTAATPQGPIVGHLVGDPARTEILIPKRQDGSQIADAWRQQHPIGSDVDDADAVPGGSGTQGDWLSAYEEYRGFFVTGGETTDVAPHIRTDPAKIDVFVYDVDRIGPGDLTTAHLGTPVHYVDGTQLGHFREINGNHGVNHLHVQNAIQITNGGLSPERTLGVTYAQPGIPVGEQSCTVFTQNIAKPDGCTVIGDVPGGSATVPAACTARYRSSGETRVGGAPFPYTSVDTQSPTTFVPATPPSAAITDGTPMPLFFDPADVTAKVFAHEASHVMGLPDFTNGECDGVGQNIMSTPNCPGSIAGQGLFHPWAGTSDSRAGFQVRQ